ncbi:MAG: hypothetical protein GTO63_28875 [Anaerolineae bacterium]|nr:hypothetical protein [Anaerolineae bacterium]NIQ81669.1 hypothetical protein [Anaerolineae bacterium]
MAKKPVNMVQHMSQNPFPRTTTYNGKTTTIVNEVCHCGHFRTQHWSRLISFGHGACSLCDCEQWTWDRMIEGGEDDASNKAIASLEPQKGLSPEEVEDLLQEMRDLRDEKEKLESDLGHEIDAHSKTYERNAKLGMDLSAVQRELKKKQKKLDAILQPFTVAKGKNRSILVDP